MCLIVFAYRVHPDYPLLLASNRDEFHARPSEPAGWWRQDGMLLGGRDLERGGSWLAVDRRGRMAAVTNFREREAPTGNRPSRGSLVVDFLRGHVEAVAGARAFAARGGEFAGVNLLLFDGARLWYASNRGGGYEVGPGVHGLSNGFLDTPWPKVERGVARLRGAIGERRPRAGAMLDALRDETVPPDEALPDTGIGAEKERLLGPCFIVSPAYGTRTSSAVRMRGDGAVVFAERTFDPAGRPTGERVFRLDGARRASR